ncbi:hypothetical protein GCM10025767_28300 [Thalassotalea piscium]|uniref:Uncharacterized protein n=1 Tax=Thalassotalea piscium TaxID=1230533 RepID=A0A7X0TV55_9GAMM|nr:hypothetical protein [Thalassotalea piscium]
MTDLQLLSEESSLQASLRSITKQIMKPRLSRSQKNYYYKRMRELNYKLEQIALIKQKQQACV